VGEGGQKRGVCNKRTKKGRSKKKKPEVLNREFGPQEMIARKAYQEKDNSATLFGWGNSRDKRTWNSSHPEVDSGGLGVTLGKPTGKQWIRNFLRRKDRTEARKKEDSKRERREGGALSTPQ